MDAALVSSTGVTKIVATGCCRVLADLTELPLGFASYGGVVSDARTLVESVPDFPTPEPRGIQNVIDALPTPKAKGRKGRRLHRCNFDGGDT